jgi:short-subunit dehydrogenase
MKVESKVIVVTGAGSGIGRELALQLLKKGARVAAVDISEKALREITELAGDLKERLSTHVVNIADQVAVEKLPEAVMAAHGQVDGLINNAGIIQPFVRFADLPYTDIERMINVNFYGTIYMTKSFLQHFLNRPEAHVVNIASMGAFLPVPGQTMYGASKAATKLLTEGLYTELLHTNVRVTIVFPGAIATNIMHNSGVELKGMDANSSKMKTILPQDAARQIISGMEGNKFRVLVGSDARFMDFLYRLAPRRAAEFIASQMGALLK